MIGLEAENALHQAFVDARRKRHRLLTVEHLLLSIIETPSALEILRSRSVDVKELKAELEQHVAEYAQRIHGDGEVDTMPDPAFQHVLHQAILDASSAEREVTGAAILRAALRQKDSAAAAMLTKRGMSWSDLASWKESAAHAVRSDAPSSSGDAVQPAEIIAKELEQALQRAFVEARAARHEFVTVEHLLLALVDVPSVAGVLLGCCSDVDALRKAVAQDIEEHTPRIPADREVDTQPSLGFQRVVQRAILRAQRVKIQVGGAEVLVAIFGEEDSHAVRLLESQSVTRFAATSFLSHGYVTAPAHGSEVAGAVELQVVLYNDDFTTMQFVVDMLAQCFGMDAEEAKETMLEVHREGSAVCGLYAREAAQELVKQIAEHARKHGHPLRCGVVVPK